MTVRQIRRVTPRPSIRYAAALIVALGAAISATVQLPAPAVWEPAATSTPTVVARYPFDRRGTGALFDTSGYGHTLRSIADRGGATRSVVHGGGFALAFPPKCAGPACPSVVLQKGTAPNLNPGTAKISFGASVLISANQTNGGQNVLQKGYSATGGQYKLQVDGIAGRPSCVMVDSRRSHIRLVRSTVTVADGTWHRVECRRYGTKFGIIVDAAVRGIITIPATLSVSNKGPLSIGGKGAFPDNDQFHGVLDDVWIRVG
jgi:hypothetical protein